VSHSKQGEHIVIRTALQFACAIGACWALPLHAQSPLVDVTGNIGISLDTYRASGASAGGVSNLKSRTRISDDFSNIVIRKDEDLGGGLSVVGQIQTFFNIDSGGDGGSGARIPGFWASGVSFVGLRNSLGSLTFGRQGVWSSTTTISGNFGVFGNLSIPPWAFGSNGRLGAYVGLVPNVVQLSSRQWQGLGFTLSWSPWYGEAQPAGTNTNGQIFAASLRFASVDFPMQYDYLQSRVNSPANPSGPGERIVFNVDRVEAHKLGVGWRYAGRAQISGIWAHITNHMVRDAAVINPTTGQFAFQIGAGDRLQQQAWMVLWESPIGGADRLFLNVAYGGIGNVKRSTAPFGTPNMRSKGWALSARHALSGRTSVFVSYTQIHNEANQFSDFGNGLSVVPVVSGPTGGVGFFAGSGADPRLIRIGMLHTF
jgi:predicted porin